MGIEIEMTGSGELGPIAPGWSVQEYATPVTIGTTAGGTGNVQFNAAAHDTSLFVVNNNITTREETLGHVNGVVKSVSQSGLNVSVSHNTPLSIFDANKNIPALGIGGIYSALDLCNQLSARQVLLTEADGHFYSLGGHSAGFDSDGFLVEPVVSNGTYQVYSQENGQYYTQYFRQQYGTIWADSFKIIDGKIWATHVAGDYFANNPGIRTSRLAFETLLDGEDVSFGFTAGPDDSNTSTGQVINFSIDYSTNSFSIGGEYRSGGALVRFGQTYDMGTLLNRDERLAVFIEYTRPVSVGTGYTYTVKVCNTSDYSTVATLTQNIPTAFPIFNTEWELTGNVSNLYRHQGSDLGTWTPSKYYAEETYSVTGTLILGEPVAAQNNTNMWEYLQNACSAYEREIASINGALIVRDVGTRTLDIDNTTVPTISPNMTLSGRSVEVNYTNAASIVQEEIYNARVDNNRVLSVKVNETITTTIEISGTPAIVYLPTPSAVAQASTGEYAVATTNGAKVPQSLWANAGGRLEVNVNPDNPNAIDIVLTGPASNYGNGSVFGESGAQYPGPYKIAYSSGNKDYAALSILATGIKTAPQTLKIYTAADHDKVAQDVAKTITNPFIATKLQAYDRGIWATVEASGPRVSVSANIPVNSVEGFGLVAGSLFHYRDSIYRINEATIGNIGVSLNASRHVTVADFDAVWNGKTVGAHDLTWAGYDTSDQVIAPLRFVGDDESVLMFLDTDVNPYYDFTGEPEISVFPDTDMNPYYADGGRLDGEDEVRLDSDSNPYDAGDGYGS